MEGLILLIISSVIERKVVVCECEENKEVFVYFFLNITEWMIKDLESWLKMKDLLIFSFLVVFYLYLYFYSKVT